MLWITVWNSKTKIKAIFVIAVNEMRVV